MKTKIIIITTLLLLQGNFLFSQCISVELSISWEEGFDIFKKKTKMDIPILNITYSNICDINYYLFKTSPTKDGAPMITCPALMQSSDPIDYRKRAIASCSRYANQNFTVIIGGEPWYNLSWSIFRDTVFYKAGLSDFIACSLENIYDYIYRDRYINGYYQFNRPAYFVLSDMIPDTIKSGSIKDKFVFLKSGESITDTYNLIGFKLVEGCFTFLIDQDIIKNYVVVFDEFGAKEVVLPAIVGEYQLFSGKFNTNKITVCFGEK